VRKEEIGGKRGWNERGGREEKEEEERRRKRRGRGEEEGERRKERGGGCTEMDGEVGIILPVRLGLYHTHRPDNA
jgi:hypothetical protein